jgi:hypothetical protein
VRKRQEQGSCAQGWADSRYQIAESSAEGSGHRAKRCDKGVTSVLQDRLLAAGHPGDITVEGYLRVGE